MQSNESEKKTSREKTFVLRNSLLTDIFDNNHTRNLYNVYVIVVTGLCLQNALRHYVKDGRVDFGLETIGKGFAKFDKTILIWLCCFLSTCATFFFFQIWGKFRTWDKKLTRTWDWFWAAALGLYYFYTLKLTSTATLYFEFNPPCAAFVSMESVRLLMKVHSFVRIKAPPLMSASEDAKFSNFLYFLFAPTLIYRDSYPRTKHIDWNFVICRLLEAISMVFMFTFIVEAIYPTPERWLAKYTIKDTMLIITEWIPHAGLVLCGSFFLVFHSVQNLFAEVTRFGDRLFYEDWWSQSKHSKWLTKWNLLVRDWLYCFVYRDFKHYLCDNNSLAIFVVIVLSFAMHEYVMFCFIGKFIPCFLFLAIVVVFPMFYLNFPKSIFFNVLLWCSSGLMMSATMLMYTFEHYAMMKAPLKDPTYLELIIPRFITCDCVLKF
ncbi:sterol O-acyltransferase 1-like isoform X2 [Zophobas morio]|uniref:sterol O-acyltransferase 1-like isoform X2 n=1 Tax=Zophobas morio TaxID=2755281 RepID=UPI0030832C33